MDREELFKDKKGKECIDIFCEKVHSVTSAHIPTKPRRTSDRPAWMTKGIMKLVRKKKRC